MIRSLVFALLAFFAVGVFAQDVSITVVNITDTSIRVDVTDSLSPRQATLEVATVPGNVSLGTVARTTPFAITVPGLDPATRYVFTVTVAGEESGRDAQASTTLAGLSAVENITATLPNGREKTYSEITLAAELMQRYPYDYLQAYSASPELTMRRWAGATLQAVYEGRDLQIEIERAGRVIIGEGN